MTGDGTNDAPALAQADVGVAMNTGTSAAKEAGNMVDLDSNPTKLIEIVEIGKQLLITRGALTTFSIANDVAKYFAIIPAMFAARLPGAGRAQHHAAGTRPQSAILSAVIFNALIIVALIPLALRGVRYRPSSAAAHAAPQPADLRPRRPRSSRSSASSSSTCVVSSHPRNRLNGRHAMPTRLRRLVRQYWRGAARAARRSPWSSASPTRWPMTGVAQVALPRPAPNGSLVDGATARSSAPT